MPKTDTNLDANLVARYQEGDKGVLNELVKRWHKKMCHKAYWILQDAELAKDIAQDSWSIIMDKLVDLKSTERFGAWALKITQNKALDKLRQQSKIKIVRSENQSNFKDDNTAVSDRYSSEIQQLLLKSIKQLSVEHQQVLQLFYVEDYSLNEIAKILNISKGTVKSRLFNSREKLKKQLKK